MAENYGYDGDYMRRMFEDRSTPFMMNPLAQGGMKAVELAGSLFADTEAEKQERWRGGQRKDLYDKFRWEKRGDVLSEQDISQSVAMMKHYLEPQMEEIGFDASRAGLDLDSGEALRMRTKQTSGLYAGRIAQLLDMNTNLTFQREENIRRMLAGLVR